MSEERFCYGETDLFEWVEDNGEMISTKECCELLNTQQSTITELKEENEKLRQENNFLKQIREAFQIDVKNSRQKM